MTPATGAPGALRGTLDVSSFPYNQPAGAGGLYPPFPWTVYDATEISGSTRPTWKRSWASCRRSAAR